MGQEESKPKSLSKMTSDEKDQELASLRKKEKLRTKLLRESFENVKELTDNTFRKGQDMTFDQLKNAGSLINDEKHKKQYISWISEMYEKYQQSSWKWLVRIIVCAILAYLIAEALIYFGRQWLVKRGLSKWIMSTFSIVQETLLWLVRGASSLFGGIFGYVYNCFTK